MTDEISSVDGFVRWVFETPPSDGDAAFYRGHSKADEYKLGKRQLIPALS